MIQVDSTNIQSKIKVNCLLTDSFTFIQRFLQGCSLSMLLCIIVTQAIAIFIDAYTRIKGKQIQDHEIKIVNFANETNFRIMSKSIYLKNKLSKKLDLMGRGISK